MIIRRARIAIALVCLALVPLGCGRGGPDGLHVYAAASLTDALSELAARWNERAEVPVVPVFGASSTLARQIVEDAPAELFLSASQQWMDHLVRESDRVISGSRLDLLSNRLVLVVPPGNPGGIEGPADLKGEFDGLALGDPDHVPAGIYAAAWLKAAGLWDDARRELRPAKDVRAALAYVERGEVDAGLVYFTDARVGNVEVVAQLDGGRMPPIRYPMALLAPASGGGEPRAEARAFHRWLLGEEASAVFRKHGFEPLADTR